MVIDKVKYWKIIQFKGDDGIHGVYIQHMKGSKKEMLNKYKRYQRIMYEEVSESIYKLNKLMEN